MNRLCFGLLTVIAFGRLAVNESRASTDSIGPNGIVSAGLNLTGDGIAIGQVERFRSGKFGYDNDALCCNATVIPADVFVMDAQADPNERYNSHALSVAGVMISTATTATAGHVPPTGIAQQADLYSSSFLSGNTQANAAIASQHLATALDVQAINMSFGEDLDSGMTLNGNSLLTLFVDWSATQHDVLYVVAGNEQSSPAGPVPTDDYNGLTVAASTKNADGVFRNVAVLNDFSEDAVGDRTSTDILAPGVQLDLTGPNGTFPAPPDNSGTSFAAPHVTGTIALLQQFAVSNFAVNANARHHEVMKAVIMNSADKLKDTGNGLLLGMDRTVLKQGGIDDWLNSDAFIDDTIPLDEEMGAGHLNAKRALQQFRPGEFNAGGAAVPSVGWDYGFTVDVDDIQTYALSQALPMNQYVSITLAWDRDVVFDNDVNGDGNYDDGDAFLEFSVPTDLNLYLVPAGMGIAQAVAKSIATDTSVEHIFAQIGTPGMYEIWVEQAGGSLFGGQNYALAWWTKAIPSSFGDYSGNGTVGPEDYTIWKTNFGTTNAAADGNGNGIVDAADYTVWRDHQGQVLRGSGSLASVPEPSSVCLLLAGLLLVCSGHLARC